MRLPRGPKKGILVFGPRFVDSNLPACNIFRFASETFVAAKANRSAYHLRSLISRGLRVKVDTRASSTARLSL